MADPLGGARRIVVLGCTGSGKSTLARQLARRRGLRLIDLDELAWRPHWQRTPEPGFRRLTARAVGAERWVVAGWWKPVRDLVWPAADLFIGLDYDLPVVFARLWRRTIDRALSGERICGSNYENLWTQLATRESLLLYALRSHGERRAMMRALAAPGGSAAPVRLFRTPAETAAWLAGV